MAELFTQVHIRRQKDTRIIESYEGSFQIRFSNGRLSIWHRTDDVEDRLDLTLPGAYLTDVDELGVIFSGFRQVGPWGSTQYEPVDVILTRPGTGWDGKEPS